MSCMMSYYYYHYLIDGKAEAWSVPSLRWRQTSFQNIPGFLGLPEILELSEQCPWKESAGAAAGIEGGWLWACPWSLWVLFLSHLGIATPTIFGGPPDYWYLSRSPEVTVTLLWWTLMMICNYICLFGSFLFCYPSSCLYLPEFWSYSYSISST